ncbi:MAG: hypothetical protein IKC01_08525, partial [Clostridia bacterium]|nr:hypothetical protein [Clostridia bacterium]
LLIASATQSAEVNVHVNENEITALGHFSECSITINNQTFDGATSIDFTDTINEMIDEKSKDFETEPFKPSVINYGAKGDGSTDDTEAFQTALSENRLVYVPEGTYKLSDTLLVRPNCELELSQATHLKFTQTEDNCIELRSSATLRGNHAVIEVPYSFTGNVISVDTQFDEGASDTPPFAHWDPMWKRARYIYDVCIVKPDPNAGLHYSIDGTCSGTGIYLSAKGKHLTEGDINFIWGAILQGIRIAGAFTYGIQVENIDNPDDSTEDDAWNHDMRIEAVIQGCETGASLTNCNTAHLAVTIQPSTAQDGTKYAKWGVYLNDCRNIDMTSSLIWDWHAARDDSEEYQHIAMYGNCRGLVLSDFLYYENSTDIRKLIYTDTPSNLEKMTILQEPITRWFKPIDGVPYFSDGYEDKKLALEEDIDRHFTTDSIKMFEDVLSKAIDTDGSIYNEVGYKKGGYLTSSADIASNDTYNTYAHTGFIKCKSSDVIHVKGIDLATNDSNCRIAKYDSDFKPISQTNITMSNIISNASYYHYTTEYDEENDEYKITLVGSSDTAYIRISVFTRTLSEYPIITVNEDIKYEEHGFLADGIKVKAENVIGLPSDDGTDGTWESMPDKPFYEKGISYEWDGVVTEGMKTAPVEGAGLTFYKISDDIINHKEIVGATVKNFFDGKEVETIITSEMLTTFDSGAWIALSSIPFAVCTTKEDIITMMGITISFASAGIWFPMFDSNNEERTYFIKKEYELKKIDPKFLYQSDLSQNDETQPDYVKNRTHWSEITNEKVILSETLVEFTEENEGFFVFESQLVEGKKYKVIWNGNEYNYTAKTVEGVVAIGNLSYLNDTTSIIYEEPFAVANMDGAAVLLAFKELPLTANVIITEYDEIVHKLPDKFIDKEFRITATRNEDSSFLVDKTFSEVQKAHSDGKNITLAFISDVEYIYYLSHISDEQIEFMSLYMANQNDPIIRFAQLTRSDTFTIRSIDLTLYRNS